MSDPSVGKGLSIKTRRILVLVAKPDKTMVVLMKAKTS